MLTLDARHLLTRSLCLAALVAMTTNAVAVGPNDYPAQGQRHPLYHPSLPPGAIWQSPHATAPRPVYFQPVKISGPKGAEFSLPENGAMTQPQPNLMAGLMVGAIYRFRVSGIPFTPGAEVYPTIELIGRTYPPEGLATRFPIPINLSETDLQNALDGSLVTRVIYVEDPQSAVPMAKTNSDSRPVDITADQDALATADALGRPIAILRIGSMAPPRNAELAPQFYFGYPAWAPIYQPDAAATKAPVATPTETTIQDN